jgi:hypothetical protein
MASVASQPNTLAAPRPWTIWDRIQIGAIIAAVVIVAFGAIWMTFESVRSEDADNDLYATGQKITGTLIGVTPYHTKSGVGFECDIDYAPPDGSGVQHIHRILSYPGWNTDAIPSAGSQVILYYKQGDVRSANTEFYLQHHATSLGGHSSRIVALAWSLVFGGVALFVTRAWLTRRQDDTPGTNERSADFPASSDAMERPDYWSNTGPGV